MNHTVRIWDLPTRLFHWALAVCVVALVVTAKLGGNAMVWHIRLGHVVLALLLFRLAWGLVGGRWSRFSSFLYHPARLLAYLRGRGDPHDDAGHSPLGALSVFALLGALLAQVLSGLVSDDEIAFAGPLTAYVSNATVGQATAYHVQWGQYLVYGLLGLHLAAIAYYALVRRKSLVGPMVRGDKLLAQPAPPSRDDARSRMLGAVIALASGAFAWWVSTLAAMGF